jgi:hypothetical protein
VDARDEAALGLRFEERDLLVGGVLAGRGGAGHGGGGERGLEGRRDGRGEWCGR